MADIQRWRHTHLMGPVTCEMVADSDGGLVTYADHLAAIVAVPSDYQLGYADGLAEARDAVEQAKDEFVHATDAAKGDFALRVYDDTLRAIDGVQP